MARSKPAHGHEVSEKPKRRKNHCFACGKDNSHGMRLKFFLDEQTRLATCRFKLSRRYQGPPGHAHGGIIATILDEAMGKVNRLHNVIALTRAMHVDYLKPVPWERRCWSQGASRASTAASMSTSLRSAT